MNDNVVLIRNLVVAAIGTCGLTPVLPIVSTYDPTVNLKSLTGGRLVVIPSALDPKLVSRGAAQKKTCKIHLCVQYKYKTPSNIELDPYMTLAESFSDYFLGFQFKTTVPNPRTVGACLETSFPVGLWFEEHIEKHQVFTSVIALSITYSN